MLQRTFIVIQPSQSTPAAIRTARNMVAGNYDLNNTDMGVVLTQAGTTCYLMPYNEFQKGTVWFITNDSQGDVTMQPAQGEFIRVGGQLLSSVTIPHSGTHQIVRETTSFNWNIV